MKLLRKIGIIGDIHAEDRLLEVAIRRLQELGAEVLLATGDIVDGRGDVERCRELLEQHRVQCVRGNHERWALAGKMRDMPDAHPLEALSEATQAYLRQLPPTRLLDTVEGKLLLCHGLGANDMAGVKPHDRDEDLDGNDDLQRLLLERVVDVLVNGHTHHAMDRVVRGRRGGRMRIVNGGTLFREHGPCCVFLDLAGGPAEVIPLEG